MGLVEGRLKRMQPVGPRGQPFHRRDVMTVRLYSEEETRPYRLAVEQHGAGAADAMFATHVGSGETELMTEKVAQEKARLRQPVLTGAVDCEIDPNGCGQGTLGR